jgi:hypothetical protein
MYNLLLNHLPQPTKRKTYKSAIIDGEIFGIRKESRPRILSLLIISENLELMAQATHRGIMF